MVLVVALGGVQDVRDAQSRQEPLVFGGVSEENGIDFRGIWVTATLTQFAINRTGEERLIKGKSRAISALIVRTTWAVIGRMLSLAKVT